ncbi:hypothetical protein [Commensalibacter nepenthis]|uniref:Uncharacterized protein n=1 Tax=Commensalibacter nepenthis TaxID=3043872 RepID=A0ABT6Q6K5_9PROT|nr:hypothetical protein [Commensalibacter sp. TBRC 10068]MDI2112528.1 hypothetical protein [Commensalibacter sp. TBRC 10068]
MFKTKSYLYVFLLGIAGITMNSNQPVFARHHHKNGPPPPVTSPKDTHLNPKQSVDDISAFAQQAAEKARQQQTNIAQKTTNEKNGPAALLPNHYTKRSQKINGTDGWVNSKRRTGKYDMGINMPVSQTADPTQNKTRGVFRRSMPVYEPNY